VHLLVTLILPLAFAILAPSFFDKPSYISEILSDLIFDFFYSVQSSFVAKQQMQAARSLLSKTGRSTTTAHKF